MRASPARASVEFTELELSVLKLVARGYTAKEIAAEIRWPLSIVDHKIMGLRRKLGAKNSTDAVVRALKFGVVQLGDI